MSESTTQDAVFIGIQLAADRVNVSAVTEKGAILVESSAPFARTKNPETVKGQIELSPDVWWDATRMALGHLVSQLRSKVAGPSQIRALSVCGTPGAILTIDRAGKPLLPAILLDDARGADYIKSLNFHGQEHCAKLGIEFKANSPLAKIAWVKDTLPELYDNALFIHQTDYIVGRLKGLPDVTEYSLGMMTGCDLMEECWPDWLDYDMHLSVRERLPRLMPLGAKAGTVSSQAAAATGLPSGMTVVMGSTSVTVSFLASGARKIGDVNTVLEDGMTISGIVPRMLHDNHGQIQGFKLPDNAWVFSVQSRTGAEWVKGWFAEGAFGELEAAAQKLLPTSYLAYPNVRKGETFPFNTSSAEGFISPATDNRVVQFASSLQGTALFERYCYQKLDRLAETKDVQGDIYSGGEWSSSDSWMQCRADVTGRVNRRMVGRGGAAFGAAMIAGMGSHFGTLEATAAAMLTDEAAFFPDPERHARYTELYKNFCVLMEEQGYTG